MRELLALQNELQGRMEDDPLRTWKAHKKQKPFIDAIFKGDHSFYWYCGANRSGKSDAGAFVGATLARHGRDSDKISASKVNGKHIEVKDRATSGWVVSLDFPNSRDVIQPKYFDNGFIPPGGTEPFIPEREISEWRATDQILKLKNGSLIGFKSADAPATKFQGAGKDWIHFDEVPPKEHYDEAVIRVEAGRKLTVFGTATLLPPVGTTGGVSWLYDALIKPWQRGEKPEAMVFTAGIRDNPYIGEAEIRILETMFPPGTKGHDIRIDGQLIPGIGGSLAYHSFSNELHVRKLPPPDPYRPIVWCWDFNVEPMVTEICQRYGSKFRVHRELILEEGNIPDMCDYFYNQLLDLNHRAEVWIYGDATGTHRNAQFGVTDYKVIQNHILSHRMRFRIKVREKNPPVADRLAAVNRALMDEFGMINVEVDPSCKELITDFEGVLLERSGGIKKSNNRKDPYYRRTHSSDGVGYWIAYEAPVRSINQHYRGKHNIRDVGYNFG
jgi:phage terminase large subunit-like protein